jgi:hypothetical protein
MMQVVRHQNSSGMVLVILYVSYIIAPDSNPIVSGQHRLSYVYTYS